MAFFSLALILLSAQNLQALTELEIACAALPNSFYYASSCYVASTAALAYTTAKHSCTDFSNGHLAHILTRKTYDYIQAQRAAGVFTNTYYWLGLEQIHSSAEPAGGWAWTRADGLERPIPEPSFLFFWYTTEPNDVSNLNAGVFHHNGLFDNLPSSGFYYLCQYEEPNVRSTCYSEQEGRIGANGTLIESFAGLKLSQCAKKCAREPVCSSFSHKPITGECHTHWTSGDMSGYEPEQNNDFNFFAYKY